MHMSEILKAELDAFRERTGKTRLDILETGTIRGAGENYHRGDGWSTVTFAEYVKANGGSLTSIDLEIDTVLRDSERCGAVAVPCHPGRARVGMFAHVAKRGPVEGVRIVEVENGGSRGDEDARAKEFAATFGYAGIGGSDSHIVSHIGRCATRFLREIRDEEDLAAALRDGGFEALRWT